jgi:Protein phosphatase 2C
MKDNANSNLESSFINWKYVYSSVAGTFHARSSLPNQDACDARVIIDAAGHEVLIAAVSDGAGSAISGRTGSKLACHHIIEEVKSYFARAGDGVQLADGFIENWIDDYQQIIYSKSREDGLTMQDYACTLLTAIVERDRVAYFQIGDGAIVASQRDQEDQYLCIFWPQQGEYANTTNFLTDIDAVEKIYRKSISVTIDELSLFTDGIQNLVLNSRTRSAHTQFFLPIFNWLRPQSSGYSQELADKLAAYLNSEKINSRTDDDRTLVVATRRSTLV